MGLGRLAHLTGTCPHTGVPFTADAITHLGVPLTWDSVTAACAVYAKRANGMRFAARTWKALSLTLVGRVHVAKQVLAAMGQKTELDKLVGSLSHLKKQGGYPGDNVFQTFFPV